MPLVEQGPLAGFYAPDYDGDSTISLMSSIIRSRGGHSPHLELTGLDSGALAEARVIIYLVIDGLGLHQLQRHLADGRGRSFFAAFPHRGISTVFPTTTAAAVTTFDTGASPSEHAILSWYLHLPDHGCIATVLRSTTRIGTPLFPEDYDLQDYYRVPSYVATVTDELELLSWGNIPSMRFASVGTRWPQSHTYQDLDGLVECTVACARRPGRRLSYAYWPRYDGLCHEHGCLSHEVDHHFDELDRSLARLATGLRGSGTTLVVLADHGLVDAPGPRCIDLAQVPGLMACLATAPAGDQRQVSLFVRPHGQNDFADIFARHLSHATVCVAGKDLLDAGIFGPGAAHPALAGRVGDHVLLARQGWSLIYTPPNTTPFIMPGGHGGMSEQEVLVPLYAVPFP